MHADNPYAPPLTEPLAIEASPLIERATKLVRYPSLGMITLAGFVLIPLVLVTTGGVVGVVVLLSYGRPMDDKMIEGLGFIGAGIVLTVSHLAVVVGAYNLRKLRSRRWALVGAWLATIPFVSPYFFLGIPFGLWALIVLRKPEVKAAFRFR